MPTNKRKLTKSNKGKRPCRGRVGRAKRRIHTPR